MMVVDASAVLEMLSGSAIGLDLVVLLEGVEIHAPHVIDLEVLHTLRRWTFAGMLSTLHAEQAIQTFMSLEITRHPHTDFVQAIWALRHNLTAYDASYLALAKALGAELVTMDSGLRTMAARRKPN